MMKYSVEFQYADKASRPQDPGPIGYEFEASSPGQNLLPNVGDAVSFHTVGIEGGRELAGMVRSRYFRFMRTPDNTWCHVNIVVEDAPTSIGAR
jgi:hypothetical protein